MTTSEFQEQFGTKRAFVLAVNNNIGGKLMSWFLEGGCTLAFNSPMHSLHGFDRDQ